jgi:TM2 domain-containing membrane protein YozV
MGIFLNVRPPFARWRLQALSAGMSAAQGSAGNVIAALASFFIPGLGQLLQGRIIKALMMFLLAGFLWWFLLGWIVHLWSIIDAALYKPTRSGPRGMGRTGN